jgi:glycosyltransferase involved in cell wall biosynthesis
MSGAMATGTAQRTDQRPAAGGAGPRVVHVMTVPASLYFLSGQIGYMRARGFELHAVASPGEYLAPFGAQEGIPVHAVAMTRAISPLRDLRALWELWRLLHDLSPDVVHAHTPKGGLLGMIAAALARVPVRVYHVRGLPFVTASGWRRRLLVAAEWTSCALAHRVLAVSHSMRAIAVEEGICPPEKIAVLAGGSGNGVDATGRFVPQPTAVRREARARLGIPPDALVIGFVGRVVREKGAVELATAWRALREAQPRAFLLVVGRLDAEDAIPTEVRAELERDARVRLTGVDPNTPPLYAAMDVVALPTYREGFPNVALEAAAMALPIVATSVPGCVDAVVDGTTGTLVPARDAGALRDALLRYLVDGALRAAHGAAARQRVLARFRREAIWAALAGEYVSLLEAVTPPAPTSDRGPARPGERDPGRKAPGS